MNQFTVIGIVEETGQICAHEVLGTDALNAFAAAAAIDRSLLFVCAVPGWQVDLSFPGSAVVHAETVLEQDDVFGKPLYQVTKTAIEQVLHDNASKVANTGGASFNRMAEALLENLSWSAVIQQTQHARSAEEASEIGLGAIKDYLTQQGILEA